VVSGDAATSVAKERRSDAGIQESRVRNAADAIALEAPPFTNTLWRQIDRWANEGGAVGEGTAPSAPSIGSERKGSSGAAVLGRLCAPVAQGAS
jgi:hypothetical protein